MAAKFHKFSTRRKLAVMDIAYTARNTGEKLWQYVLSTGQTRNILHDEIFIV